MGRIILAFVGGFPGAGKTSTILAETRRLRAIHLGAGALDLNKREGGSRSPCGGPGGDAEFDFPAPGTDDVFCICHSPGAQRNFGGGRAMQVTVA